MASKKKTAARIVLLDAHAILHRAYHALPDFTSPNGEPTGALYGLAAMLFSIIEELKPDYIFSCYDLPEKTFRHEAYKDYKAGRQKADDALVSQMIRSREIFDVLNIPIYEKVGFEADDLLGTLATHFKKQKDTEVIIASGDMDTLQLVDKKKVRVYTLRKGIKDTVMYDEDGVNERFGFGPTLLPDFKGLRGDPSDNIIGIAGIGEKTATELITTFGSIEDIYKTLHKKDGEKKMQEKGIKPRIITLLTENEEEALFSKELATIRCDVAVTIELPKKLWREGLEPQKVVDLFHELGFRTLTSRFKSQFGAEGIEEPEEEKAEEEVNEDELRDTAVALWLLQSETTNPTLDDIYAYTGEKTLLAARKKIFADLAKEELLPVYEDIEQPLLAIVAKMEEHGVLIDKKFLGELSKDYHKELTKLEKQIHKAAGSEFNINSPRQLGKVLFDDLGLTAKNLKKTAGGQRSTRESELEKLRDTHPIVPLIFDYRELQKLLSTYIDNIPQMLDKDNRLHAHFSQTGAATGRMSSQHPNMQNLPTKTERGRVIRNAVMAPKGCTLAAFDYSQVELRIAAFLSGDPKLIEIFKQDQDIHASVAAYMFSVSPEDVTSEMRRRAKVINFGILYGMGVNALKDNLGVERKEAQEYLNNYFNTFSTLATYLEDTKAFASRMGYTKTFFGRKRYFEGIRSPLPMIRAANERMAINAPIQGTQADITKLAMSAVDRMLEKENLQNDVHLILQVHDELVFEVKDTVLKKVAPKIQQTMQGVMSLTDTKNIPLKVDLKTGTTWGEMK